MKRKLFKLLLPYLLWMFLGLALGCVLVAAWLARLAAMGY
jgi:hypothetical protein